MRREDLKNVLDVSERGWNFSDNDREVIEEALRLALRATNPDWIPTSWLDSLLTGPKAVIGKPPYDCKDIERLLLAIRERAREQQE